MYLLPIQVPIYLEGERQFITTEWHRSLMLLRDSLGGRYGDVVVAAPTLPAGIAGEQRLISVSSDTAGIKLVGSFDKRCRARHFWLRDRAKWKARLAELIPQAAVVHGGVDDVYRPIAFEGFRAAVRAGVARVFVQDTDNVLQQRELAAEAGIVRQSRTGAYTRIYERMCRWSVARADLSLLKGSALMRRYGRFARNAREFQDTSFSLADIVPEGELEQRLATLNATRPLRLVYCGRLTARKGVDRSIRLLAAARGAGATVELDIIGAGAERTSLENLTTECGLGGSVRFSGAVDYDSALLRRLAAYDAMLFTPIAEDTPRMIFDGYAAGLPLVAFDIDYVRERAEQEQATVLLPRDDMARAADIVTGLSREPALLAGLARAARKAAEYHAAENWYRRRAQWTFEAVDRHGKSV